MMMMIDDDNDDDGDDDYSDCGGGVDSDVDDYDKVDEPINITTITNNYRQHR